MTDLAFLDATAQAELVRAGDATPADLVDAAIGRIEAVNPELNAVIHPLFDRAHAAVDAGLPDGPFRGVPIVIKDWDGMLAGAPFHGGNKLLKEIGFNAPSTAYLFQKLEAAGFVIVGKTNTPEFGFQPTTEPEAYGPAHNPWDTTRGTGGSSGGSAASVAAGLVPVGHAGDGGGSIRIPASACGLFGLKPTRGRISLGPDDSEAWANMVVRHVVTRTVRDSAKVLELLAGPMPGDYSTTTLPTGPYSADVGADPGKLRVGLRTRAPGDLAAVDPVCAAAAEETARRLEALGHTVVDAGPAALDEQTLLDSFIVVLAAEATTGLELLATVAGREVTEADVEPLTWSYAELGKSLTAAQHVTAIAALQSWARRTMSWWFDDGFDLLLTPTMAEPPPLLGDLAYDPEHAGREGARATPFACFTLPFNVTGQPAMSVPLTWSASGLPIGSQLVAMTGREDLLIKVAAQLEAAHPWAGRIPPVHA
jgi:amidase